MSDSLIKRFADKLDAEFHRIQIENTALQAKVDKQSKEIDEQFESIDTLQRYHRKRYAALQVKVDELKVNWSESEKVIAADIIKVDELTAAHKHLKEVCWCVWGSIQDKDDRQYLRAALKQEDE